jgi:hypothetical protein
METITINPNDPKDVAKVLSKFVNGSRGQLDDLAQEVLNDHPTLQQTMMRFVFKVIFVAADHYKKKFYIDGRNEISFRMAEKIQDQFGDDMYCSAPLI